MKKYLLLVLITFVTCSMSAQLVTSTTVSKTKKQVNNSGMFFEVGIGALGGDIEGDGVSLDLGLGYRKGFNQYIAWDILKVKAMAEVSNLGETITPQLMTGIRGTSPTLFANVTAYGSFSGGYGYVIDAEEGGFAYEIQAGLNITPKFYVAFVYDNQGLSFEGYDINFSFTGARLGIRF